MENDFELEEITYTKKRKLLFELKDMLAGLVYPFMVMIIFSSTIISFSSDRGTDLTVKLITLIGGEVLLIAALIIFGRANGAAAYKATVLHDRKRSLGSKDELCVYGTGEYRLWKGFLLGFILTVPFIIFLTIQLIAPNTFCSFCLKYVFAWAYSPVTFFDERFEALSYLMILMPVGLHALGYYLGKLKEIKVQQELASQELESKNKRRRR